MNRITSSLNAARESDKMHFTLYLQGLRRDTAIPPRTNQNLFYRLFMFVERASSLLVFIFSMLLSTASFAAGANYVVINSEEANLHTSPGSGWTDHRVTRNAIVRTTGAMKDGWYPVVLRNGESGWLPSWLAEPTNGKPYLPPAFGKNDIPTTSSPLYGKVISDGVYFREIPYGGLSGKLDTSRRGDIPAGAVLEISDRIGHWMKARLSPMEFGWVYDEAFTPVSGNSVRGGLWAELKSIKVTKEAERSLINIVADRPLPYYVESTLDPDAIKFKVYGVNCDSLRWWWNSGCGKADGWCVCAGGANVLEGYIPTPGKPAGYKAEFEGNTLQISARNPVASPPRLVVIDAGHGAPEPYLPGYKEGAPGPNGCTEKKVTLAVSKKLEAILKKRGIATAMTRTGDSAEMIDVYKRVVFSDRVMGDVFVSIHANGDTIKELTGFEVYWYDQQSRPLAEILARTATDATGQPPGKSFFASFAVIRQTRAPSVLVELGYLSNKEEGTMVCGEKFQDNAARGLANGIIQYLDSLKK